jgi:hypothetical protein
VGCRRNAGSFRNKKCKTYDDYYPGMAIHEMGTARMGNDPKTSVLNKWNQMHEVSNVFVTDGSCMPSIACQNPSLTFMALTARACDYAKELKKEIFRLKNRMRKLKWAWLAVVMLWSHSSIAANIDGLIEVVVL